MINLFEETALIMVNAEPHPDRIAVTNGPLAQVLTEAHGLRPQGHLLKLRQKPPRNSRLHRFALRRFDVGEKAIIYTVYGLA